MLKWLLPAAILLMSVVYIFINSAMLFKLIPMGLILIYAFMQQPSGSKLYSRLTLIGLLFCMLGDWTLQWFVIGLSSFLIGHLFYTAAFASQWKWSWLRALTLLPLLIYGLYMGSELWTALEASDKQDLIVPVMLYLTVIATMCWTAIMTGNVWAVAGGILFIASDSILAWNMFVSDVTYSGPLIMSTYYGAQFLIARSIQRTPVQRALPRSVHH